MCKTKDRIDAGSLIGNVVQSVVGVEIWGIAEYVTPDGYFGIRQVGGRLDEVPVAWCVVDPT